MPSPFEAWLDEENRIVSFHEIPDCQYYCAVLNNFYDQNESVKQVKL